MAAPRYIYQRRGGPIVRWDHESGRPPHQTRAGDATALGSLGDTPPEASLALTMAPRKRYRNRVGWHRPLPKPGAPEYLGGLGSLGDDPATQPITVAQVASSYMPVAATVAAPTPAPPPKTSTILMIAGGALAAVAILFGGK